MTGSRTVTAILFSITFHALLLAAFSAAWKPADPADAADAVEPGFKSTRVVLVGRTLSEEVDREEPGPAAPVIPVRTDALSGSAAPADTADAAETSDAALPEDTTAADGTEKAPESSSGEDTAEADTGRRSDSGGIAEFGGADAGDSGPEPVEPIKPEYPAAARRMGVEGVVVLEVSVSEDGRSTGYRVIPPRAHRVLEEAAVDAALNARYRPAIRGSRSAADTLRLRIVFRLEA
jgi:protein TonB